MKLSNLFLVAVIITSGHGGVVMPLARMAQSLRGDGATSKDGIATSNNVAHRVMSQQEEVTVDDATEEEDQIKDFRALDIVGSSANGRELLECADGNKVWSSVNILLGMLSVVVPLVTLLEKTSEMMKLHILDCGEDNDYLTSQEFAKKMEEEHIKILTNMYVSARENLRNGTATASQISNAWSELKKAELFCVADDLKDGGVLGFEIARVQIVVSTMKVATGKVYLKECIEQKLDERCDETYVRDNYEHEVIESMKHFAYQVQDLKNYLDKFKYEARDIGGTFGTRIHSGNRFFEGIVIDPDKNEHSAGKFEEDSLLGSDNRNKARNAALKWMIKRKNDIRRETLGAPYHNVLPQLVATIDYVDRYGSEYPNNDFMDARIIQMHQGCLDYDQDIGVFINRCSGSTSQLWKYDENKLIHWGRDKTRCLDGGAADRTLYLGHCDPNNDWNRFTWSTHQQLQQHMDHLGTYCFEVQGPGDGDQKRVRKLDSKAKASQRTKAIQKAAGPVEKPSQQEQENSDQKAADQPEKPTQMEKDDQDSGQKAADPAEKPNEQENVGQKDDEKPADPVKQPNDQENVGQKEDQKVADPVEKPSQQEQENPGQKAADPPEKPDQTEKDDQDSDQKAADPVEEPDQKENPPEAPDQTDQDDQDSDEKAMDPPIEEPDQPETIGQGPFLKADLEEEPLEGGQLKLKGSQCSHDIETEAYVKQRFYYRFE